MARPHLRDPGGGLIAPGMPAEDEQKFMAMVLTTWGKACHGWPDPKSPGRPASRP
jgi:hypothetical protein